jgi:hypothetical protein
MIPGKLVTNASDLRNNIRNYKEQLLQEIVSYLKTVGDDSLDLDMLDKALMFNSDGAYTGILE